VAPPQGASQAGWITGGVGIAAISFSWGFSPASWAGEISSSVLFGQEENIEAYLSITLGNSAQTSKNT
jgi:hypothetical protein